MDGKELLYHGASAVEHHRILPLTTCVYLQPVHGTFSLTLQHWLAFSRSRSWMTEPFTNVDTEHHHL